MTPQWTYLIHKQALVTSISDCSPRSLWTDALTRKCGKHQVVRAVPDFASLNIVTWKLIKIVLTYKKATYKESRAQMGECVRSMTGLRRFSDSLCDRLKFQPGIVSSSAEPLRLSNVFALHIWITGPYVSFNRVTQATAAMPDCVTCYTCKYQ
jgi:hypothetical protein